jgi:flagellar hook-basal body complex protein FliE
MAADPVSFLPALRAIDTQAVGLAGVAGQTGTQGAGGDFGAWLARSLDGVQGQLVQADQGLKSLATGEAQNLHQVMISLEEARVGLQLLVQVRNRLLESYQEILRMQV